MKKVFRTMVAAAVAVAGLILPASRADAASTWRRSIYTNYSGHSTGMHIYADTGTGNLFLYYAITTGNLAPGTCLEAFHNLDIQWHRSPDFMSSCQPNRTITGSFWMVPQETWQGNYINVNAVTDWSRKGVNLCVTPQQFSNRNDAGMAGPDNCGGVSSEYLWNGSSVTGKTYSQPSMDQYNGDNYNTLVNGPPSSSKVRSFRGSHWRHDLEASDIILNPGTTWSSYWGDGVNPYRYIVVFQSDGNLVTYRHGNGTVPVWASGTNGIANPKLRLQTDGNIVITSNGACVWNSGSWGLGYTRVENGHDGYLWLRGGAAGDWKVSSGYGC